MAASVYAQTTQTLRVSAMEKYVLVTTTFPDRKTARRICGVLLDRRLAACVQYVENIESSYWWKGKITDGKEFVLIVKTISKNFEKVKIEVEKIHPYEIPCIVKIPVSSNKKYFEWLVNSTK